MPLVHMSDMLRHAYDNRYAVGAFDVVSLDFITGVIAAAEEKQAPVIISLAESHFEYFDFELLMAAVEDDADLLTAAELLDLLNYRTDVFSDDADALTLAQSRIQLPPQIPEWLTPLVSILPAQLFACHLTQVKGYNTDAPRTITKVTETH